MKNIRRMGGLSALYMAAAVIFGHLLVGQEK